MVFACLGLTACMNEPATTNEAGEMITRFRATPSMSSAVPMVMKSLDLDKDNKIDVDLDVGGSTSTNIPALLSKQTDFVLVARNQAFDFAAQSDKLVIVAPVLGRGTVCILSNDAIEKSGISAGASVEEKLKAFEGLTIATTPDGTSVNLEMRRVFEQNDIDPDRDVKLIGVTDPSAIVAGIKNGKFDGSCFSPGVAEANIAAGEASMWLSAPRGDFGEFMKPGFGAVVLTRADMVEKHPDVVRAMFDSLADANAAIVDDPTSTGALLHDEWLDSLDSDLFELTWESISAAIPGNAVFDKESFENALLDIREGDSSKITYEDFIYEGARE